MLANLFAWLAMAGVLAASGPAESSAGSPLILESLRPAARARIGERGLYTSSLTRLANGNLLACAHYGASEAQRLSVWLSTDVGATWKRIQTKGDALFGSGAALRTLKDGTVLLHTGVLYRSGDGGVTWKSIECPDVGLVRTIVEQPDGKVFLYGSAISWHSGWDPPPVTLSRIHRDWFRERAPGHVVKRKAWRVRSGDAGRTWSRPEVILDEDVPLNEKTKWGPVQPLLREASFVALSPTHLLAAARRSDPEEHAVVMESRDGGMNWAELPGPLPEGALHPQLLALKDGRLLCTYVQQEVPRGIFGVFSSDQGRTWDTTHPVYLAASMANLFGWPTSIQLPDGTAVTSYTIKAYEESTQIEDSATEVVRWQPSKSGTPSVRPLSASVFTQAHDPLRYPSAVTGFTGGDLQQISFWEYAPAERAQLPGYKGAMARFPDGELLSTPFEDPYSVIYRSKDEGRTWTKVAMKGDPIPAKEQSMICLRDNRTVLLQTEAKGTPLFRSTDRGVTWKRIDYGEPTSTMRNFVELSDGSVLMFGCAGYGTDQPNARTRAWRLRSVDGGLTWPERKEVKVWDSPGGFFGELFVLPYSDTKFLAATRVEGYVARRHANAAPIDVGKGAAGETDECMVLMESNDGGLTWSNMRTFLGYSAVHVWMTKLADGRLLAVYRRRYLPFAVSAVISEDDGKTWIQDNPIIVGTRPSCYGGWPTSLQMRDGTILTTRAFMDWPGAVFEAIRWKVPPRKTR